jgi:hypothetical protein
MALLPPKDKRSKFRFYALKKLPYGPRLFLIFLLLFSGIIIQLLFGFLHGALVLFAATLLGIARGIDFKQSLKHDRQTWHRVTPDEYKKIEQKAKDLAKWDRDFFNITNFWGKSAVVLITVGLFASAVMIKGNFGGKYAAYWVIDFLIVLLPHWITGTRQYRRQDSLLLKTGILTGVTERLRHDEKIHVLPMLATRPAAKGKTVPVDAKLMIKSLSSHSNFIGMQVLAAVNIIEGKRYPYIYCILLARKDSRLFDSLKSPSENILFQKPEDCKLDVLIIKQNTRRFRGYYTRKSAVQKIVNLSLNTVKEFTGAA